MPDFAGVSSDSLRAIVIPTFRLLRMATKLQVLRFAQDDKLVLVVTQ
jgi:hypothetical protein